MEWKQITGLTVGVVIGALLLTTLVIPVIGETTTTERTFTNDGYFTMDKYSTDDSVTIEWDHTSPDKVTVNDEEITVNSPQGKWVSIAIGDNWYFRFIHTNSNGYEVQMSYGSAATIGASTSNSKDITIVCSEGTATGTLYTSGVADTPKTVSYTELYVISTDGQYYIMKDSDVSATMLKDSEFVGIGQTFLSGGAAVIKVAGTIEDGATVTIIGATVTASVDSDTISVNATPKNGYVDCYDLTSITFDVTTSGGTTHATYNYFIVPASVTAELSQHLDSSSIEILSIVPLLITVGIIMAVVGVFVMRRE